MYAVDLINKLSVSFVYPDNTHFSNAPTKQASEKSDYYYERYIATTIDTVFARFSSENINIDNLSIDLGLITPEEIPYKLTNALENELKKHRYNSLVLPLYIQEDKNFVAKQNDGFAKKSDIITKNIDNITIESDNITKNIDNITIESDIIALFLNYLANPLKPWYWPAEQEYDVDDIFEKAMKICLSDKTGSIDYFYRLINLISGNKTAFKRFTGLINSFYGDKVLKKYLAVSKDISTNVVKNDLIVKAATGKNAEATQCLVNSALSALRGRQPEAIQRIEQKISAFSESRKKEIRIDVLQYLLYGESDIPFVQKLINEIFQDKAQEKKSLQSQQGNCCYVNSNLTHRRCEGRSNPELTRHYDKQKKHNSNGVEIPLVIQEEENSNAIQNVAITKENEIINQFLNYLIQPAKSRYLSSEQTYNMDDLTERAMKIFLSEIAGPIDYFNRLIYLISSNKATFKRFTKLVNSRYIDKVLKKYLSVSNDILQKIVSSELIEETKAEVTSEKVELLKSMLLKHLEKEISAFSESRKKEIRIEIFQYLLYGKSDMPFVQNLINEVIKNIVKEKNSLPGSQVNYNEETSKTLQNNETVVDDLSVQYLLSANDYLDDSEILNKDKQMLMKDQEQEVTVDKFILKKSKQKTQNIAAKKNYFEPVTKRIPVSNAGLIVLNPLLVTLFTRLNFLDNKKMFRTEKHRQRAVHLLQLMTGEKGKHHEYLLPLNKIMCGLHPAYPVDPVFRATKKEKEESESLLKSVIEHWKAARGVSIKGLQETFIRRNGAIESSKTDWILRVENKGVDILLDDLPWSISTLAFPWNEYIIHVEWKR